MNKTQKIFALFLSVSLVLSQQGAFGQQLNALDKAISKDQMNALEQEKAILESMEEVVEQLDLLSIDKQQQLPEFDHIEQSQHEIEQQDKLELLEQALLDDSFDDLDIDQELADELDDLVISKKMLKPKMSFNKKLMNKTKNAVGVQGEEELLINQLDNSNLMDFDAQSDVWLPEVEKFPIKQGEIDDIE